MFACYQAVYDRQDLAPLLGDNVRFLKPVPSSNRVQPQNARAASWLVSYSLSSPIWSAPSWARVAGGPIARFISDLVSA